MSLIHLILVNHQELCSTLYKVLAFPYPAYPSNPAPASTVDKTVFLWAVKNFAHFYSSKKNFKVRLSNRVEKKFFMWHIMIMDLLRLGNDGKLLWVV